jgi:fructose-1,6-bisphosphatase/inositol monophosphatase family enzyme
VRHLRALGDAVRERVLEAMHGSTGADVLAASVDERGGDTIYTLDVHAEEVITDYCERWAQESPFVLVAEGVPGGRRLFPSGADESAALFTLVADPIDGTRGLMHGKRSGWALFGVASARVDGRQPTLADIRIALQMELPTPRAALADVLWAIRGEGVWGETIDLRDGTTQPFSPAPSGATSLRGGFASLVKFFPGTKVEAAGLEERLFAELTGLAGTHLDIFDDEYICSGGQLYELAVGHDRFIADLRPVLTPGRPGDAVPSCHPYDLCTWIIATEAGVIVTDAAGEEPSAPLDTETPVAWVGYANEALYETIWPVLRRLLEERR